MVVGHEYFEYKTSVDAYCHLLQEFLKAPY
jgi:hypothetical protein